MTKKLIAMVLAGSLAIGSFSTPALAVYVHRVPVPATHTTPVVPWLIIGCAGGIILAAFAANGRDNRELTAAEAWVCGIPFWFSQPSKRKNNRKGR